MQKSLIEKLIKKKILVIDDEGTITRTLCVLLKKEGYFAAGSEDSFEAIDKAEEADYDLIIADIKMPGIDGIEVIRRIRSRTKQKNKSPTPVVFITGYTEDEAVERAKRIGEVIFKPFDTADFLSKITRYLD